MERRIFSNFISGGFLQITEIYILPSIVNVNFCQRADTSLTDEGVVGKKANVLWFEPGNPKNPRPLLHPSLAACRILDDGIHTQKAFSTVLRGLLVVLLMVSICSHVLSLPSCIVAYYFVGSIKQMSMSFIVHIPIVRNRIHRYVLSLAVLFRFYDLGAWEGGCRSEPCSASKFLHFESCFALLQFFFRASFSNVTLLLPNIFGPLFSSFTSSQLHFKIGVFLIFFPASLPAPLWKKFVFQLHFNWNLTLFSSFPFASYKKYICPAPILYFFQL